MYGFNTDVNLALLYYTQKALTILKSVRAS